ncbi:unnamed protein product [Dicrocoelium dendriticum]|nr:unnamed protein product [Dicrocoelium dendriticum]
MLLSTPFYGTFYHNGYTPNPDGLGLSALPILTNMVRIAAQYSSMSRKGCLTGYTAPFMSVWRRLQRIGKKAAKFQFTICFQELSIECHPQYGCIRYLFFHLLTSLFVVPREQIGRSGASARLSGPSVRRRVLATRQVEMSEFASAIPTQTSLKVNMRLASKKLVAATLLITLHSMIVKEGDATDEDMISLASLMSLSRAGSFSVGSGLTINDVGGIGACSPSLFRSANAQRVPSHSVVSSNEDSSFHADLSELTARLQALERVSDRDDSATDSDAAGQNHTSGDKRINFNPVSQANNTAPPVTASQSAFSSSGSGAPSDAGAATNTGLKTTSTASGRDLLAWCQDVTRAYASVHITDLTTSFQSGLAFCALLHHFYPDKIDFDHLVATTPVDNCRLAFDVASKLGVPRVLDPAEVTSASKPPDLLTMMTYLHQLRTHLTGSKAKEVNLNKDANCNEKSLESKALPSSADQPLPPANHVPSGGGGGGHMHTRDSGCTGDGRVMAESRVPTSPSKPKSVSTLRTEHMLAKARLLLQQTKQQQHLPQPYTDALPPLANCRKPRPLSSASLNSAYLTDIDGKFTSFDRDACDSAKPTSSRYSSASTIFVPNGGVPATTGNVSPSHWSNPLSPSRPAATQNPSDNLKIRRLRLSQLNLFASGRGTTAPVPIRIGDHRFDSNVGQTSFQFGALGSVDDTSPHRYAMVNSEHSVRDSAYVADASLSNYLRNEQAELDRAQQELDQEAAALEKRLRIQMARAPGSATEEQLLKRWFVLVNQKSALIHRAHQLSIMEKEDDLKKKTEMLQEELRRIMSIEDSLKTDSDRRREELLLEDLVNLVNERNDMINELDEHERALAEEMRLDRCTAAVAEFSHRGRSEKCVIQ